MGEPARQLDMIDVTPAFTRADAQAMQARFEGVSAQDMLRELLAGELRGRIAAVSSFGAESAVLLHMVAQVDVDVPVVFTNTQKMFGETLAYRDELAERLGFTDLRVFRPDPRLLAIKDKTGLRWSYDPDGCCDLRKVEPLARGLTGFDASFTGRKAFQSASGLIFSRPSSSSNRGSAVRVPDWKPLRPEIHESNGASARRSGSTLRRSQQPSGS